MAPDAKRRASLPVPTDFETNEFTTQIADTYGMPRYGEFDHVLPAIITFPSLFTVIHGDIVFYDLSVALGSNVLCFDTVWKENVKSLAVE